MTEWPQDSIKRYKADVVWILSTRAMIKDLRGQCKATISILFEMLLDKACPSRGASRTFQQQFSIDLLGFDKPARIDQHSRISTSLMTEETSKIYTTLIISLPMTIATY
jgi:hypothetical protein